MPSTISAHTANVANWVCSALTIVILLARLASIRYQLNRNDASFYIVTFALVILVTRVICNYYILKDGTVEALRDSGGPIPTSTYEHAKTGSILSLVARMLITTFYWLMCILLLLVYRRILSEIVWVRSAVRVCWIVMLVTYLAVVLTTFLECHPFRLWYQLHPDPGSCVRAYAQLLVQCLSNIVIDLLLMTISMPILKAQARTFPHNLQLGSIFILGTFCIIITCVRVYYTYQQHSAQNARSFWASVQAVVAAFVANAPSIYGAVLVKKRKQVSTSGKFTGASGTQGTDDATLMEDLSGGHAQRPSLSNSANQQRWSGSAKPSWEGTRSPRSPKSYLAGKKDVAEIDE